MEKRNIIITLDEARELYNSENKELKNIALQAFKEEELNVNTHFDFYKIKSFKDALLCFYEFDSFSYNKRLLDSIQLKSVSRATSAMFKLNIIRKALNMNYNMHLTQNACKFASNEYYTWYPYFRLVAKNSYSYKKDLQENRLKKIGEIISEDLTYDIFGGCAYHIDRDGLSDFSHDGIGYVSTSSGFLGCATKEIAEHFGLYFGMLIIEAMYADMIDFKII